MHIIQLTKTLWSIPVVLGVVMLLVKVGRLLRDAVVVVVELALRVRQDIVRIRQVHKSEK